MGEQISRALFAEPAAPEEEQRVSIDLPDRRAVFATHIVVEDLKLRLCVDTRFVREQQVAAVLHRVGSNRPCVHHDLAAENRMRGPVYNTFVQLDTLAFRYGMIDQDRKSTRLNSS